MGMCPPCTQTWNRTHVRVALMGRNVLPLLCIECKRPLGSLTVTPHCQEVISKRSSGQISCTMFFAVGHVGDSFDMLILFATDNSNTPGVRLHLDAAETCESDYRLQITDYRSLYAISRYRRGCDILFPA